MIPPTPEEVRAAVRAVLERSEFAPAELPWIVRVVADARRAIQEWIAGLLTSLTRLGDSHPVLFWILVGWLVLSLLGVTAHLVYTTVVSLRAGGREKRARGGGGAREGPRASRDAGWWEEEARTAASEGRFREAAVALFRGVLLRLEARGRLRFDDSRTPGEYVRDAGDPELRSALEPFVRSFVRLAYGPEGVGEEGWLRLRASARGVVGSG